MVVSSQLIPFKFDTKIKALFTDAQLNIPQKKLVCMKGKKMTIMRMTRCLLFESKLPNKFCVEAINTSIYLQNWLYKQLVSSKIFFKLWHVYKPLLECIKVFESICYLHVSQLKRGQLDKKAQMIILSGYTNVIKGYRVFNLETQKLVISLDVKVGENTGWDWIRSFKRMQEAKKTPCHNNKKKNIWMLKSRMIITWSQYPKVLTLKLWKA